MPRANAHGLPRGIQLRNGAYRVRVNFEGRQHVVGTFDRLSNAKAALAIAKAECARGTFLSLAERRKLWKARDAAERAAAVTVDQWATQWLALFEREGKSAGTIISHRSTYNAHVRDRLGPARLVAVTREQVEDLLADVKGDGARRNVHRTLGNMYARAIKDGIGAVTSSPVAGVVPPKKPRPADMFDGGEQVATEAEVAALAARMPEPYALMVPIAAEAALRLGEVLALRRQDLAHLDRPAEAVVSVSRQYSTKSYDFVAPKAGSIRTVSLPASLVPAIVDHLERHVGTAAGALLFPSARDPKKPVSQTSFNKMWTAARDAVKPGFRYHDLRHSGLTRYARAGATQAELMARGGHRDAAVSLRYQHSARERDRALVARMDQMRGRAVTEAREFGVAMRPEEDA